MTHRAGNATRLPRPVRGWILGLSLLVGCWDAPGQHVGNQDCVACHRSDYEATTDPPHVPAFPETCGDCHSTDAWVPAVGGHPEASFPIAMGPHGGIACADCHDFSRAPNGPENTTCVGCHSGEHMRETMDALHTSRAVAGYPTGPQEPNFCLVCHPDGTASQATHPEPSFPIATGAHLGVACNDCHLATRGPNGPGNTDCVNCHSGDHLREVIDPLHAGAAGYPTGPAEPNFCLTCHPDGTADSVQHPEAAFPITRGPHERYRHDCAGCHNPALGSNIGGMNADCVGCHDGKHTRTRMDRKHREVRGYPRGDAPPNFCLDCHPRGRE